MHFSRFALLAPLLTAGLIAGCGSAATPTSGTTRATPAAATGPVPSTSAFITTKHAKLGTILALGSRRMTVYLFARDTGPHPTCTGACAAVWPPVTGTPRAHGGALASALGTIKRADGTRQVTYHQHPLYLFVKDRVDGDAFGQAIKSFGAAWYVLAPSGTRIGSAGAQSGSSSSTGSSSGYTAKGY